MIGQLIYNEESGRIELDGNGLHCGEALKVLIVNGETGRPEWIETRLEYSDAKDWYLIGLLGYQVAGLFAELA